MTNRNNKICTFDWFTFNFHCLKCHTLFCRWQQHSLHVLFKDSSWANVRSDCPSCSVNQWSLWLGQNWTLSGPWSKTYLWSTFDSLGSLHSLCLNTHNAEYTGKLSNNMPRDQKSTSIPGKWSLIRQICHTVNLQCSSDQVIYRDLFKHDTQRAFQSKENKEFQSCALRLHYSKLYKFASVVWLLSSIAWVLREVNKALQHTQKKKKNWGGWIIRVCFSVCC